LSVAAFELLVSVATNDPLVEPGVTVTEDGSLLTAVNAPE